MSDSIGFILAIVFSEIVPAAIFLYGAYWALAIRRALVGRMYRNHALWLGVLGILLAVTSFVTYTNDPIILIAFATFYAIFFVVFFAFIDSTVRVARRSDPLLRSILRWERLRVALWVDVGALVIANSIPAVSPAFASSPTGQAVGNFAWTAFGAILFAPGAAALIIGARRSRDASFRGSLKWLGMFLSLGVLAFLTIAIEVSAFGIDQYDQYYSYPALPFAVLITLMAYALYRSARSLVPMNRLQITESAAVSPTSSATS